MAIQSLCVCGAGTMGAGIAQAAAQSGYFTVLYELNTAVLEKARHSIEKNIAVLKEKGKLDAGQAAAVLARLRYTADIQECLADVFIEAIVEKAAIKAGLFNQLAEINHGDVIFATNTSSLSVTAIAEQVHRPERVIGLHFFNPATLMKLVEVVLTPYTNEATRTTILSLAAGMGKTAVLCKDAPGFIVNRVARPYYIESLRLVEEGITSTSQADRLLESAGFRLGPFKLMDLIGNDVNYAVSCSVYEQLGRPERLKPSYLQEEKVKEGKLGKKTGEGYYRYEK